MKIYRFKNIGGIKIKRKKLKFDNEQFLISVYSYSNGRLRLKIENNKESHDISMDLKDTILDNSSILIDPVVLQNGLINYLKKARIIKEMTSSINYGYTVIPIAKLNMQILRKYDSYGVTKYYERLEELK